jgi:hypothetical protein
MACTPHPSKEDAETLERGTDACPVPARDDAGISDQCSVSPPSPSALCGHPHRCAAIPSTAMPSPSLWEPGTTRHRHPRHCTPPAFRQLHPRAGVRTATQAGGAHAATLEAASGAAQEVAMTPAGSEIRQDDQQLHDIVHHTTIRSLELCSMIVNRLPLVYNRRSRSPGRRGKTDCCTLAFFRLHHDIDTLPQSNLRDLEASPPLPPCL